MAAYTTRSDKRGGVWHVYPGGRQVYVAPSKPKPAAARLAATTNNYYAAAAPDAPYAPPVDPEVEARKAAQRQVLALGDISDTYQRTQLSNQYGFGDTSNPYSRAKMLEATYKGSQASNINSYARQGQLYSGALQTAQNTSTFGYNKDSDALQREYQAAQNKISQAKLDRYASSGQVMDDATYQSIARSLQGL